MGVQDLTNKYQLLSNTDNTYGGPQWTLAIFQVVPRMQSGVL